MSCCCGGNPKVMQSSEYDQSWTVDPTKPDPVKASESSNSGPAVPEWLNEEYFIDVLQENVGEFKKIQEFKAALTGGNGENYGSVMFRVKVKVELKDGTTTDVAYMVKTLPNNEQGAMLLSAMGLFPKESTMYGKLLPEFEKMYHDIGKTVRFGPKFYEFKKNPGTEYILLEDLSPSGFKNTNRLEGLDEQHVLSVLNIVAQLHAASAVRYETLGKFDNHIMGSAFGEKNRQIIEMTGKKLQAVFYECLSKNRKYSHTRCMDKVAKLQEKLTDLLIESSNPNLHDFNVIAHGDLWSNNIMFRYNDNGELEDTILIDFQLSRFTPPVTDLFYFLLSSPKLELKVACFDKFVKFYHEQLVENLTLLKFPKNIPTLRDFHIQLLTCGIWGFSSATGIMAGVLMDPSEDADIGKFINDGEESNNFQKLMFENPRYVKHLDVVLEWLDLRGLLDF